MSEKNNLWLSLLEYSRWYPSPHNTQPIKVKILNNSEAEIYFVQNRGLRVGDPKGRFTFLTFGIFVEILKIAAGHKGYELKTEFIAREIYISQEKMEKIANLKLVQKKGIKDMDPELVTKRKTSRLPYNHKPIPNEVMKELQDEAHKYSHNIEFRTDPKSIKWVVELNKDSFFFDLKHKDYREELRKWLRYSEKEADEKKDGLDMKSMRISGLLARSFMYNYWIYTAPIMRQISEFVYKKTMKGISTIAWIQGPYQNSDDWVRSGRLMIRLWLIMTKHNIYWQPYGSVITNDKARSKLIDLFDIQDEEGGKNMVWLLLRMGYSEPPPRSRRLNIEDILLS